mmetsp:Transcript_70054/g.194676  ORF Transcript_70054/g.194676 Transcript_70054/m.194676 type:complete len:202 (+) Transcript_70054:190-795(+)
MRCTASQRGGFRGRRCSTTLLRGSRCAVAGFVGAGAAPRNAMLLRRPHSQADRKNGFRAIVHDWLRRQCGTRLPRLPACLLPGDAGFGFQHRQRVAAYMLHCRWRHRLWQRCQREAHCARLRAGGHGRYYDRGPGLSETLRPHARQVGCPSRRGSRAGSRGVRCARRRALGHLHHGEDRRACDGQHGRGHKAMPGIHRGGG